MKKRIQELIQFKGGGHNETEVADIIENALKLLTDVKDTGDVRVIQTALRELRYAFRLFAPYAGKRKVTIFGSARTQPDKLEYQQAVEFGRKIVQAGFMVITGAGRGIMQAGHEGAGPENSFGVNIRLPWEQSANPVIAEDKKLITFKYFFTRKLIFIRHSDAIVLFPGGFGTFDEGYEAITLMQTGKSQLMPLVLVDKPGGTYWKTWDIQRPRTTAAQQIDFARRLEPLPHHRQHRRSRENHHALLPEFSFHALREGFARHPAEKCAERIRPRRDERRFCRHHRRGKNPDPSNRRRKKSRTTTIWNWSASPSTSTAAITDACGN